MSIGDHWNCYGKCAAAVLGGIGSGFLGGAAAASAIPFRGTISGGLVGGVAGALSDAAAGCGKSSRVG